MIVAIWWLAAAFLLWIGGNQINFWIWCWQGDRLSRQFDALVRERNEEIDPLVLDPDVDDEEKRCRVINILERFEEHAERRAHWVRCRP